MPQSLTALHVHVVFSTRERIPFLADPALRSEMHRYLGAISSRLGCQVIAIGGVADHIHVLANLNKSGSVSDWVKELKRVRTTWAKQRDDRLRLFSWQQGYAAFAVSASDIGEVRLYIERQESHHQDRTFQDELRAILRDHQVEWSEEHLWSRSAQYLHASPTGAQGPNCVTRLVMYGTALRFWRYARRHQGNDAAECQVHCRRALRTRKKSSLTLTTENNQCPT